MEDPQKPVDPVQEETKAPKKPAAPKETAAEKKKRLADEKEAAANKIKADAIPDPVEQAEENKEPAPVVPEIQEPTEQELKEKADKEKEAQKEQSQKPDDAITIIHTGVLPQHDIRIGESFVVGFDKDIPVGAKIQSKSGDSEYAIAYKSDVISSDQGESVHMFLIHGSKGKLAYIDKEDFAPGKTFSLVSDEKSE